MAEKGNMDVSVIIPTYNRSNLIKYTLDSLAPVLHPGIAIEIIVIDDGSVDDTWAVIEKKYPHVILMHNTGKGAPMARNTGLAAATAASIMYLDSDDLVGPGFFAEKVKLLNSNRGIDACYGAYDNFVSDTEFNEKSIVFKHKYPVILSSDKAGQHLINYLGGNFLPPNALIWRKELLSKINGHDPSLNINQDVDFFIRAIFKGARIIAVEDGTKVYIRQHGLDIRVGNATNTTGKHAQILALRKRIFSQLDEYGYNTQDIRYAMSKYLFDFWRTLRHEQPALANDYLEFAKKVQWPVQLKGSMLITTLSKLLGPVNAVKVKYMLTRRD